MSDEDAMKANEHHHGHTPHEATGHRNQPAPGYFPIDPNAGQAPPPPPPPQP